MKKNNCCKYGCLICAYLFAILLLFSCAGKGRWHLETHSSEETRDAVEITAGNSDPLVAPESGAPALEDNSDTELKADTITGNALNPERGTAASHNSEIDETSIGSPDTFSSVTEFTDTKIPGAETSKTEVLETKALETKASDTKAPETVVSDTAVPATENPQPPIAWLTDHSDSVARYVYDRLSAKDRAQYDAILNALIQNASSCTFPAGYSINKVRLLIEGVLADHPEIFWTNGAGMYMTNSKGEVTSYEFQYIFSKQEISSVKTAIEKIKQDVLGSLSSASADYEKAIAVYRYIIKNTTYDYPGSVSATMTEAERNRSQTLYDAMIGHNAVCAGYAKAVQYLLQATGIEAVYVSGTAGGNAHAWLLYKMDGNYYYMDPTWGDPLNAATNLDADTIQYVYFAMTSEELQLTHTAGRMVVSLPECTATSGNYYTVNHLLFAKYEKINVQSLLATALKNKAELVTFRYADDTVYMTAVTSLQNGDLGSVLSQAAADAGMKTSGFDLSWSYDPSYRIIELLLSYK